MVSIEKKEKVGVRELRGSLSGFLRQARNGTSFVVMSHNEVVAEIHPPLAAHRSHRKPGALRGKIDMAADFDNTSAALIAAMEGEAEG